MCGAIPPLSRLSSWRGAQLNTGAILLLPFTGIINGNHKLFHIDQDFNTGAVRTLEFVSDNSQAVEWDPVSGRMHRSNHCVGNYLFIIPASLSI
jgi:hypothetical protein